MLIILLKNFNKLENLNKIKKKADKEDKDKDKEDKFKECKGSLEYITVKDDSLIIRCLNCNKNYENEFDKGLKTIG